MFDLNNNSALQSNAVNQQAMAPIQAPGIQAPTATTTAGPAMAPITGAETGPGFMQKGGALQIGVGAIQTLGSLWNSFQQQKMAKKTFNLNKDAYETNLANQRSTYNSALEDRIRSRGAYNGASEAESDKIIEQRSL